MLQSRDHKLHSVNPLSALVFWALTSRVTSNTSSTSSTNSFAATTTTGTTSIIATTALSCILSTHYTERTGILSFDLLWLLLQSLLQLLLLLLTIDPAPTTAVRRICYYYYRYQYHYCYYYYTTTVPFAHKLHSVNPLSALVFWALISRQPLSCNLFSFPGVGVTDIKAFTCHNALHCTGTL